MGEPPVEGAVKATDSVPFPVVTPVMVGAGGTRPGIPDTATEGIPLPQFVMKARMTT